MKLIKAIILVIIFIAFLSAIFLALLKNDKFLTSLSNYLLTEQGIHISELTDTNFTLQELSIGHIKITRENLSASLSNVEIKFSIHALKPELESIAISRLELKLKSETSLKNSNALSKSPNNIELSTLFPDKLYALLKDINLRIEHSKIIAPDYLQNEIEFSSLSLSHVDDKLILEMASLELPDLQVDGLQISAQPDISLQLLIHASGASSFFIYTNNTKTQNKDDSLALHFHPEINAQGNIDLRLDTEIKLKQIATLIQPSFMDSAGIHAIQGTINIKSKHTLIPIYNENIDIQDMFLASSINSQTNLKLHFQEQAIESVSLNLFADVQHKNTSGEKFTRLNIDKNSELKIQPDSTDPLFKNDPSLLFLSTKAFLLKPKNELLLGYESKNISMQGELTARWADASQRAFVDYSLNQLSGKIESKNHFEIKLNHKLKARWNRFFASNHQAQSSLLYQNNALTFSSLINEDHLKSSFDIKGIFKQKQVKTSYTIETLGFSSNPNGLNETLAYWDEDLKLLDGKIKVQGSADINFNSPANDPVITYLASLSFEDLDLDYDDIMVTRINTRSHIKGKNLIFESEQPFLIKIDDVFSGLSVKKIRVESHAQMNLESLSTIDFSNLKAQVLGGTASSAAFTLSIPFSADDVKTVNGKKPLQPYHSKIDLDIKDLQLGEILALQGNPEIEGKGLLYGKLPITVNEKNTLISKGWIKNQNPGTLRYRPNASTQAMLKQNNEMKLLLDVLGHLNYHTFEADIDLNDEGMMKIKGSLQGVNPDFKKGYPLVLNPNIELDLRDMLRSLQFTRDVSGNLTKRAHQK